MERKHCPWNSVCKDMVVGRKTSYEKIAAKQLVIDWEAQGHDSV